MNKQHCTELQLELLAGFPEKLTERDRKEIDEHVSECKLCEEHLETLRRYYADLEQRLAEEPSEKDKLFARALLALQSRKSDLS